MEATLNNSITEDFLSNARTEGDFFIDDFLNEIFEKNGREGLSELMEWCKDTKNFKTDLLPSALKHHYLQFSNLPEWAEEGLMNEGFAFFKRFVAPIAMLLGCYSLPYCYAGADGAQVLYFSEKIYKNTTKRLNDTGDFVREMHIKANFKNGEAFVRAYKVRLMHGIIRVYLKNSGKWNEDWGLPLNQEDKAGTNLAFSYIVLVGLKKLGFQYSDSEAEAYLHTWKVIGHFMGVKPELLLDTMQEAALLDRLISKRNFRSSEVGKYLTKALIDSSRSVIKIPFLKEMPTAIMREMLGKDLSEMLEIPDMSFHQKFIKYLPFKLMVRKSKVIRE
jgi:ER-bound oxygenase mpaB/B'/Rubber oxygenase, catalytic domain